MEKSQKIETAGNGAIPKTFTRQGKIDPYQDYRNRSTSISSSSSTSSKQGQNSIQFARMVIETGQRFGGR